MLLLRYGDIFSKDVGPIRQVMVCDFKVLQEMLTMEEFSGRGKPTVMGINIFKGLRGGHGGHGIMFNEGLTYSMGCPLSWDVF